MMSSVIHLKTSQPQHIKVKTHFLLHVSLLFEEMCL